MKPDFRTPDDLPWLDSLNKDPISVLLKAAPLPIRYQVLRDILDDKGSDDLEALQKNLRKHLPRRKKLAEQQPDGLWPIGNSVKGLDPKQIQTFQFITQLEALHELLELLVTSKTEKVILGMREVIRFLAEKELPLRSHHVTQAIYLAIEFKLESNPVIKQLVRGIIGDQNSDGGWSSLADEQESCYWSSLFFLWTMGHSQIFRKNRSLQKGLRYMRSNLLLHDQSKLMPGMQPWDTLITGTSGLSLLTGGSLRYLEMVQLLDGDKRDRKAEKLVDWLIDIQLKNGLWPSIVGRDKHGDHGVTLRVLKVLKHFQTQRLNETLKYESDT